MPRGLATKMNLPSGATSYVVWLIPPERSKTSAKSVPGFPGHEFVAGTHVDRHDIGLTPIEELATIRGPHRHAAATGRDKAFDVSANAGTQTMSRNSRTLWLSIWTILGLGWLG